MITLDLSTFFGRFHPLLIHLPIGFILLSLLLEFIRYNDQSNRKKILSFVWFLSFISAALSAFMGWLLAQNGHYTDSQLSLHQWTGILLVLFTGMGWVFNLPKFIFPSVLHRMNKVIILFLLIFVGHFGGSLTHGPSYLYDYAPTSIKTFLEKPYQSLSYIDAPLDSVMVYEDLIQPIFDSKCMACHNDKIKRGGLSMNSYSSLIKGGKSGAAIVSKNLDKSLIFNRITRSQKEEKFMPPSGVPITYEEIQLVEWWIRGGAEANLALGRLQPNQVIQQLLLKRFSVDTRVKPWYETVQLEPLPESAYLAIENAGFSWRKLSDDNSLLDLRFQGNEFSDKAIAALDEYAPYITWLNLSDSKLRGSQLKVLAKMLNLTRLGLQKNPLVSKDLNFLNSLEHLSVLNLHSTRVNNSIFEVVKRFPVLEKLFLWNTRVTTQGIQDNQQSIPNTKIIGGI